MRGGRSYAVAGNATQPDTFYTGSVGGGVWKTENAGRTWVPISDDPVTGIPIGSIGAIAVAPSDANIVYVGTGEPDIRSQHSYCIGLFKSTDAGKTWHSIGLPETRQIGRHRRRSLRSESRVCGCPWPTCTKTIPSAVFIAPQTVARTGKDSLNAKDAERRGRGGPRA